MKTKNKKTTKLIVTVLSILLVIGGTSTFFLLNNNLVTMMPNTATQGIHHSKVMEYTKSNKCPNAWNGFKPFTSANEPDHSLEDVINQNGSFAIDPQVINNAGVKPGAICLIFGTNTYFFLPKESAQETLFIVSSIASQPIPLKWEVFGTSSAEAVSTPQENDICSAPGTGYPETTNVIFVQAQQNGEVFDEGTLKNFC